MNGREEFVDRRQHERFKVKAGAFAGILNTVSDYTHTGKIIDISEGGLSFNYTLKNGGPVGPCKLDLLFQKDIVTLYFVRHIPVEIVWFSDAAIDPTSGHPKTKKTGVKFKELSPEQRRGLDVFIQNYTIREGPD